MRGVEDGLRASAAFMFMLHAWIVAVEMCWQPLVRVWCVKNLRGDAQPSPYRVLFVAPGRRVWRARRRSTRLRARRCGFRRFAGFGRREAVREAVLRRHERRGRAVATRLARTVRGVGTSSRCEKKKDSYVRTLRWDRMTVVGSRRSRAPPRGHARRPRATRTDIPDQIPSPLCAVRWRLAST